MRTKPALRAASKTSLCSPFLRRTLGDSSVIRLPSGSDIIASTICETVCRATGLPHRGQCGTPTRANSNRR